MLLAVDVGNTNIVMGGYQFGKLSFTARIATDRAMEPDQYAVQLRALLELHGKLSEPIESVIIASVVPSVSQVLQRAFARLTQSAEVHLMTLADAPLGGVEVVIDNPAELGMDILASAIAVRGSYPLPAVIIDLGTATKLTALDENGRLLGVAISPGLFLSLNALISGASLLQGIPLEAPENAIGKNSQQSIKSGVVLGTASMLDGMIDRFAAEMGGLASVVATGGAAALVVPHCRHTITLNDTLLLEGMLKVNGGLAR